MELSFEVNDAGSRASEFPHGLRRADGENPFSGNRHGFDEALSRIAGPDFPVHQNHAGAGVHRGSSHGQKQCEELHDENLLKAMSVVPSPWRRSK